MMHPYQQVKELIAFMVEYKLHGLTLDELAGRAGLSPTYVQKLFTQWVGVSPKQFGRYLSLKYAQGLLAQGATLEKTALRTGLSGTGRLHDLFVDIEAMTPGEYKNSGEGLCIAYDMYESPFGICLIATTDIGVSNILFGDSKTQVARELHHRWPHAALVRRATKTQQLVADYICRVHTAGKIKLHLHGTNFQLKVWEALLSIPEGMVASYSSIAKQIGEPAGARAVGSAVGDNPIGYLIPCHRVLQSSGAISGYHWGVNRKRAMLEYEAIRGRHT